MSAGRNKAIMRSMIEEIWNNDKFVAARAFFASGYKDKVSEFDLPCYTCPMYFKKVTITEKVVSSFSI